MFVSFVVGESTEFSFQLLNIYYPYIHTLMLPYVLILISQQCNLYVLRILSLLVG